MRCRRAAIPLSPIGLLPIAIAGFDIKALVQGAQDMEKATAPSVPFEENIAAQYAAVRNALYNEGGKKIEKFKTTDICRALRFHRWYVKRYREGLYTEIIPARKIYNRKEKKTEYGWE